MEIKIKFKATVVNQSGVSCRVIQDQKKRSWLIVKDVVYGQGITSQDWLCVSALQDDPLHTDIENAQKGDEILVEGVCRTDIVGDFYVEADSIHNSDLLFRQKDAWRENELEEID